MLRRDLRKIEMKMDDLKDFEAVRALHNRAPKKDKKKEQKPPNAEPEVKCKIFPRLSAALHIDRLSIVEPQQGSPTGSGTDSISISGIDSPTISGADSRSGSGSGSGTGTGSSSQSTSDTGTGSGSASGSGSGSGSGSLARPESGSGSGSGNNTSSSNTPNTLEDLQARRRHEAEALIHGPREGGPGPIHGFDYSAIFESENENIDPVDNVIENPFDFANEDNNLAPMDQDDDSNQGAAGGISPDINDENAIN